MCVDSADDEESGESERDHQSYTNSAFSSQLSPPEHTCNACGGHFETPAKKVTPLTCYSLLHKKKSNSSAEGGF